MPYNNFKDSTSEIYQLIGKLVNIKTGKVVKEEELDVGPKEEVLEKAKHLKETANVNRTDGNVWKFSFKYIGNQLQDSVDQISKAIKEFKTYINWIYNAQIALDDRNENSAHFSMHVPSELTREEFEEDVQEFCDEHNCTFELINQAPNAPSPQFFPMNTKLMYPTIKNYDKLKSDERLFEAALDFWKKNWDMPFNEEDPDDQEELVNLYNEYVEGLREWKPVELRLYFQPETVDPIDTDYEFKEETEDAALPYHVLAWNLYELMRSMNHENAYWSFANIWPDGETKEQCKEDFGDKSSYEDLKAAAERAYKRYHKYGLFTDNPKVIALAHEFDKRLGLEPIEVITVNKH